MNNNYTADERDRLIQENMHLVPKVAFKYKDLMHMSELVAAGNLGLVKGVDKYDPGRGYKVSTYVVNWIKAEILSTLYENRNVHIPWNKINKAIKNKNENKEVDSKEDFVKMELSLDQQPYVDDSSGDTDDNPYRNRIEVSTSLSAESVNKIEERELKDHINFAIQTSDLSDKEKFAVVHKFGLNGQEPKTLQEIATLLNYSRMGAHKLQRRAMKKLSQISLLKDIVS